MTKPPPGRRPVRPPPPDPTQTPVHAPGPATHVAKRYASSFWISLRKCLREVRMSAILKKLNRQHSRVLLDRVSSPYPCRWLGPFKLIFIIELCLFCRKRVHLYATKSAFCRKRVSFKTSKVSVLKGVFFL